MSVEVAVIRLLVDAGVDLHQRDDNGMTALSIAACNQCANDLTFDCLIIAGADVNSLDSKGYNILQKYLNMRKTVQTKVV